MKNALAAAAGSLALRPLSAAQDAGGAPAPGAWFDISLAQWSYNQAFWSGAKDKMRFAQISREEFGIGAVEYVNQFYAEGFGQKTVDELARVSREEGVRNVLIMCDHEGRLGDPDEAARTTAIENHVKWIEAAAALDCHAIRVNAASDGEFSEQLKLAADGLRRLSEIGDRYGISVIVENHGGLSSNGAWLAAVMALVGHPRCGTLPDFGNFRVSKDEEYDRYLGTKQLMPYAKGVSAKTFDFDEKGEESTMDFRRLMEIARESGYRGYVGVEWEGDTFSEPEGIAKTRDLLVALGGRL